MALSHSPSIITQNLVLCLDAANIKSYSGIGTAWGDLSGNGKNGTLFNSPTYNNGYSATRVTGTRTDANASSLVLAIPMDGTNNGTTFTDESANIRGSGSAKSITRNGDTKTVTAISKFYGSSGYFDGNGDTLAVPALGLVSVTFTIEFWVYMISAPGGIIVTTYNLPGGAQAGAFFFNRSATNQLLVSDAYGTSVSSSPLNANQWYHAAMVYTHSASRAELFVNGVSQGTASFTISAQASSFFIGGSPGDNNVGSSWFNGYLQDFRVYIGIAKYTSNFIPFGNPNTTPTGAFPIYNTKDTGGSLVFNGTNQYSSILSPSPFFGTLPFTFEIWVNFTSISGNFGTTNKSASLFSGGTGTGTGQAELSILSANNTSFTPNTITFSRGGGGTTGSLSINVSTLISNGSWYQIVLVRSSSNSQTVYLNSSSIGTGTVSNSFSDGITSFGALPGNAAFSQYLNGKISNIKIYNRALSAAEVSQNYNALKSRYV